MSREVRRTAGEAACRIQTRIMGREEIEMKETMDIRWLRYCLTGIVVLLGVIAVELGALLAPAIPRAQAQVPDAGRQRRDLLDQQTQTNVRLDAILQTLKTGPIKVTVVGTDKDTKPAVRKQPASSSSAAQPR